MHEDVMTPEYQTFGSVCFDLRAYIPAKSKVLYYDKFNSPMTLSRGAIPGVIPDLSILPGQRFLIPTGLKFDIPHGYHLKIYLRSSVGMKKGLIIPNGLGVIDTDYTGEVIIGVYNPTHSAIRLEHQERIAQVEICKSHNWDVLTEQTDIEPELRGNRIGGIGSTGK